MGMADTFNHSEHVRRARDRGRAGEAWRWFSERTRRAADHYRDLSWSLVARQGVLAGAIIVVSRIDPSHALSPWLLVGGAVWLALTVRIGILKLLG
jgi:hypothetical protein